MFIFLKKWYWIISEYKVIRILIVYFRVFNNSVLVNVDLVLFEY